MILTDKAIRVATRDGFLDEFWRDLSDRRAHGEKATHQEVFDDLNFYYEAVFGKPLFKTFSAFRAFRDRKNKKCANVH